MIKINKEKEKKDNASPTQQRGTASAVAAGYKLYLSSFRRLFRAAWPVAVAYAITMSILSWYAINVMLPAMGQWTETGKWPTSETVGCIAFIFQFILVAALLASTGFAALIGHRDSAAIPRPAHWYGNIDWKMGLRTIVAVLWLLVVYLAISAIAGAAVFAVGKTLDGQAAKVATIACVSVMVVLTIIFTLPLLFTVYAHLFNRKAGIAVPPTNGYGLGLAHLGLLFGVALVVSIVTMLLTLVLQLPALILYAAGATSQLGAIYGDPVGMPESMTWVSVVVFAIAGFLQAWLHLSTLFPLYYAYGSIGANAIGANASERLNNDAIGANASERLNS